MDDLFFEDHGFKKEKTQLLCVYLELDLNEMDYFNVVIDGRLVEESVPEVN